ncbi:MAG: MarR family transcriptional regulator [Oryzomonas sp.]|uniref:MarR family winged helix-turn-helix transcriptional regulator n=1 Tax=Oryzomonas sp. TaxID=2855186 RepID=UPI00283C82EB|nr:MarR family transcriptional regulator [Oryzomonas sp.]MDR3579227.1 MarR family transcriptional regulator [Oryzomonas sp.]
MFDIEQSVGFGLSKARQCISAVFKEEFKDYGITLRQFMLLAFLWETDGLSQIELARKTDIDRATMVGIIDRLEKAEILRRTSSAEDRRAHLVWLTEKGRRLEQDLCRTAHKAQDRIKERMTPGEYKQLKRLLHKLLLLR